MFNDIKDLIIQDQKRTIERLQEELRDKSDLIFNLMNVIEKKVSNNDKRRINKNAD